MVSSVEDNKTSAGDCPLRRVNSVSSFVSANSDLDEQLPSLEVEMPVLGSASVQAGSSVSVCSPVQGVADSVSAEVNQSLSHKLIGDIEQSNLSSQEQADSVIPCIAKNKGIPSTESKTSSEIPKVRSNVDTGAIPKSKNIGPQEQRNRRIKVPKANKKNSENNDQLKGSGLGKTKGSSK